MNTSTLSEAEAGYRYDMVLTIVAEMVLDYMAAQSAENRGPQPERTTKNQGDQGGSTQQAA